MPAGRQQKRASFWPYFGLLALGLAVSRQPSAVSRKRTRRGYSGESLRLMVSDAIARWTSYGCSRDILKQVCSQVFVLEIDKEAPGAV